MIEPLEIDDLQARRAERHIRERIADMRQCGRVTVLRETLGVSATVLFDPFERDDEQFDGEDYARIRRPVVIRIDPCGVHAHMQAMFSEMAASAPA